MGKLSRETPPPREGEPMGAREREREREMGVGVSDCRIHCSVVVYLCVEVLPPPLLPPLWPSGKALSRLGVGSRCLPSSHTSDLKQPCKVHGVVRSVLGLVGSVSRCDWVTL